MSRSDFPTLLPCAKLEMERRPTRHCTTTTSKAMLTIPQEIVDIIIDQVASQLPSPETTMAALSTLKACCLVSTSFRQQARRHLFSEIHLVVDKHSLKTASNLNRSLENTEEDGLINAIRTLALSLDLPSSRCLAVLPRTGLSKTYSVSRQNLLRLFNIFYSRPSTSQLLALIDTLNSAPLDNLGIVGKEGFYTWNGYNKDLDSSFERMCTNDALKSLRFDRVLGVPQSLLIHAIRSTHLQNLRLSKISITLPENSGFSDVATASHPLLVSNLRTLEATGFSCSNFFAILRSFNRAHPPSAPRYPAFSHLRELSVSVPTIPSEMDELWQFLQHVSPSLQALELQQCKWSMHDALSQGPIRLSTLTSLRNLNLTTTAFDTNKNFGSKQEMIARFLTADSSANGITAITIDIHVHRSLKQRKLDHSLSWRDLGPISGWAAIDSVLSTPAFPNLRKVVLNVKLFYFTKDSSSMLSRYERTISTHNLLPTLASTSWIGTDVNLHTVNSPRSFLDHFQVV